MRIRQGGNQLPPQRQDSAMIVAFPIVAVRDRIRRRPRGNGIGASGSGVAVLEDVPR